MKKNKFLKPLIVVIVILAVIIGISLYVRNLMNSSEIQVNMNDVYATINSCLPVIIPAVIVLVVALIIWIVSHRLKQPVKYIVSTQSIIAMVITVAVAVNAICFGPVYGMLSLALMDPVNVSDDTYEESIDLINQIADEGMVLLKNEDDMLPLSSETTKLNVFGWGSTNSLTSRGSGSDPTATSLLEGLEHAGYEVNNTIVDFYTNYCSTAPYVGLDQQDWTIVEPTMEEYDEAGIFENAKEFSDTAVIVISRAGGENADLPMSISDEDTFDSGIYGEAAIYTTNPDDVAPEKHFLELSNREETMVDRVANEFDNVIVAVNSANAFELGWVDEYDSIKGVILCSKPGQTGFDSLGKILNGTVNPSGKLPDTYAYDLLNNPIANNFGFFKYDNMDDVVNKEGMQVWKEQLRASFVNYVEGIYVGYKYYETAAAEGLINYDDVVQYPFGYGLSYTEFDQRITGFDDDGTTITVEVEVTNVGDVAGKDVAQIYYTPPYYNGGIEKSEVNLVGYEKTELLEPGQTEVLTITFDHEDMASYDTYGNGCYVLEHGDYDISLRSDAHTVIDSRTVNVTEDVIYNEENAGTHAGDQIAAENHFDFAEGDVTYLSRADHFANYEEATAEPNTILADEYIEDFICMANYDVNSENDDSDTMPVTGADNNLTIRDMTGLEYDDPQWEEMLDQLTVEEMGNLISLGGYSTQGLDSIDLSSITETDGPSGVRSNFAEQNGTTFPAQVMLAATWNKDLAAEMGRLVAEQSRELQITGWYAPGLNIHRSAFGGRNIEYYSEDPYLTGSMGANATRTAVESGLITYVKHFALNEQETNRNDILLTWCNEQAIREIYLKPFEMVFKEGNCNACMSSFNYIGNVYAGACPELLNTVLRDEWGFEGMVITDYFADYGYMISDNIIRNGGDKMLTLTDMASLEDTTSATAVSEMRRACHNILYTIANSNGVEDWNYGMDTWEKIFIGADIAIAVLIVLAEVYVFTKGVKKKKINITVENK